MTITVNIEQVRDAKTHDGFCQRTGWKDTSGKTQSEWLCLKLSEYVVMTARTGFTIDHVKTERAAYVQTVRNATLLSKTEIPDVSVSDKPAAIGVG